MYSLLSHGNYDDEVSIYLVLTDTIPKFGVAKDLKVRMSYSYINGNNYIDILLDERIDRYKAACIEATLKLQNNGSEWISDDEVDIYINKIMDLLNKPTTNPFE